MESEPRPEEESVQPEVRRAPQNEENLAKLEEFDWDLSPERLTALFPELDEGLLEEVGILYEDAGLEEALGALYAFAETADIDGAEVIDRLSSMESL